MNNAIKHISIEFKLKIKNLNVHSIVNIFDVEKNIEMTAHNA